MKDEMLDNDKKAPASAAGMEPKTRANGASINKKSEEYASDSDSEKKTNAEAGLGEVTTSKADQGVS
jgi:hypothetical protein